MQGSRPQGYPGCWHGSVTQPVFGIGCTHLVGPLKLHGSLCPRSHFRDRITLEQVLNAPIIAWPPGLFDCCGISDGSAAAVLAPANQARKYRDDPVHIEGIGAAQAALLPRNRPAFDWLHFEEVINASC